MSKSQYSASKAEQEKHLVKFETTLLIFPTQWTLHKWAGFW